MALSQEKLASLTAMPLVTCWNETDLSVVGAAWKTATPGTTRFRGRIVVPQDGYHFPEQTFVETVAGDSVTLENEPGEEWPHIVIEALRDHSDSPFKYKSLRIRESGDSVRAQILFTRLLFSVATGGSFLVEGADRIHQVYPRFESELLERLRGTCSIVRKLAFIELALGKVFARAADVSQSDAVMIELAYRALTQGEFSLRNGEWTFRNLTPSTLDVDRPPFTGPGRFSRRWEGLAEEVSFEVLGQSLFLGPFLITINNAEIANRWVLDAIEVPEDNPIDIRFVVYDHQISYRFERYVDPESDDNKAVSIKLSEFKAQLRAEESEELLSLIDHSLQGSVSSREAVQIAMGWLYLNRFPDRYCAQEPSLDPISESWIVPIDLVYSNGKRGSVGELAIDSKRGVVTRHVPVDTMRTQGALLAEKLLHVG